MPDLSSASQSFAGWLASLPNRRRGQLIDLLVCLGGVLVGPLALGYLLVAAFVAHGVGAYLKRNPEGPENLSF